MNILIGTPVHEIKDYAIERWLANVARLIKHTPADFLMVDNSVGPNYAEKVRQYCAKAGISNYKLVHIELPPEQDVFERVGRSREVIRQRILDRSYDAWFSWECDQIIPDDTLDELINMMAAGGFNIVNHNGWFREMPNTPNPTFFGITLIDRRSLENNSFILEFGTDPDMPDTWEPSEEWFKERVLREGGSCLDALGVIDPIYHLNK